MERLIKAHVNDAIEGARAAGWSWFKITRTVGIPATAAALWRHRPRLRKLTYRRKSPEPE